MSNKINIKIGGKTKTLDESDIMALIQVSESYFDNMNPKDDYLYFPPLLEVIKKIHDQDSPFWSKNRKSKIQ